jgi:hypothetical protein
MTDVSILAQKARAARFATSFDNTAVGPAGVFGTRREPALLTDRQVRLVEQFARVVLPWQRRDAYRAAVHARLSGAVGDSAVRASCIQSAKGIVELRALREAGLVTIDASGGAKLPTSKDQYRLEKGSKAILGTERRK